MGFLKKVLKKVTNVINPAAKAQEEAKRQAEEAKRQAEEEARARAITEAAANQGTNTEAAVSEASSTETDTAKKKKLASGRKSLTVARSGGSGINI